MLIIINVNNKGVHCGKIGPKKKPGMFAGYKKIPTFATAIAEIAQLVEHNLAKVGVASSSLVFRVFRSNDEIAQY